MKDKLVLITGASSGIGKACAEIYAKNGANLILVARRGEKLKELAKELEDKYSVKIHNYIFDVRNHEDVISFSKDLENSNLIPDVFINNAGLARGQDPIYVGNIEDWDTMIDTNIKGLLYMCRGVIPLMMSKNEGSIINLGSIAGRQVYAGGNVYNATKYAVRAISEATNIDLLNTNIRVCNIEPGAVETEFSIVRFNNDKEKADNVYKGFKPLVAEDIANIIYFVTSLPPHVNVQHLLVTPTAQRSVNHTKRDL